MSPECQHLYHRAHLVYHTFNSLMFTTIVAIVYHTSTVQSLVLRSSAFNFPTLMRHYCTVPIPIVSTKLDLLPLTFTPLKYHIQLKIIYLFFIHTCNTTSHLRSKLETPPPPDKNGYCNSSIPPKARSI
uniref:Uncharacterized protein n=1 Tax=Opuntia streptacantha TaxID=393608 RepID=A0A7C8Z6H1_OPUST